ncbi:MAG: glycosyltransferase family 39 protein, partial [Planctomycetota bacterium]
MRAGDWIVVGLLGAVGAVLLLSSDGAAASPFRTDGLYATVILPARGIIGWTAVLAAAALTASRFLPENLADRAASLLTRPSPVAFAISVFLFIAVAGNAISDGLFQRLPSDVDDPARLFQAQTYLEGRLSVELPPEYEAFSVYSMHHTDGRLYGKYEPLPSLFYALSLALFGTAGVINALLVGVMVACTYLGIRHAAGERTARLTALLLCLSPAMVFMTASYLSHPACASLLAIAFLFSMRDRERPHAGWLAATGAALSLALAARPYTAVLVGGVLAVHAVARLGRAQVLRRSAVLVAGALPGVLAFLAYNAALTGDPLVTPFHAYAPDEVPWFGYNDHTPAKGLQHTLGAVRVLNLSLFGWPASLLFVPLVFLGERNTVDRISFAAVACLVAGMFTYFWMDYSFGGRFYFALLPF